MFDDVMRNTLEGHFGFELTFGNQFGEQAYWILLLLLPVKILFGNYMHYFLIFYNPLFLFISATVVFIFLKRRLPVIFAFLLSVSYIFSFGTSVRGIFEAIYGFHSDIASGFCLVIITLLLIKRHAKPEQYQWSKHHIGFIILYILFISTKQEMALLAVFYFSILYIFYKDKYYLRFSLISCILFLLGMICTYFFQTEYNRGNDTLLITLLEHIQNQGLQFFSFTMLSFFLKILIISIIFIVVFCSSSQCNYYAFALFMTGIIKSLFSFISNDFSPFTWHNYPCFILITGAIIIQLSFFPDLRLLLRNIYIVIIFCISLTVFFVNDVTFLKQRLYIHKKTEAITVQVSPAMQQLKQFVPKEKIVSIPTMSACEWVGHKFTLYPRGIIGSQKGIADYAIITKENAGTPLTFYHLKYYRQFKAEKEFIKIAENRYFILYKRIAYTPESLSKKIKFFKMFNLLE